jgi:2',3'-cyclic-nucleotide 2'-phosphodiesterase (5'-nucleotidase family)
MKKLLTLLLTLALIITLSACNKTKEIDCKTDPTNESCVIEEYIDIYYLNDFHGALLDDDSQIGIAYIANLINTNKAAKSENVLFLAGGDMLQGSALSNYYEGESTINLLNLSQLDAYTIGNHEFDWGLDTVLEYNDGNIENGEADFPFLGANIFYKGTTDMPEGIDPYTIIEKGGHKVGIIGTMGYGLESSIAESKIADYDFAAPLPIIKEYTEYLRTTEGCDLIIVMSHDSGAGLDSSISQLTGDQQVDIFFNAHSHSDYVKGNSTYVQMQSGHNGEYVGLVHVEFGDVISMKARNMDTSDDTLLYSKDDAVSAKLEEYILETNELFNDEIIVAGEDLSTSYLSKWVSQVMLQATESDIAFQNYGGTRTDVDEDEAITYGLLYQIFPFDNVVKTAELTGSEIKALMKNDSYGYSTSISNFEDATLYKVAASDYIFDKPENPFIYSDVQSNTYLVMRDLALAEMELQATIYSEFLLSNSVLTKAKDPSTPIEGDGTETGNEGNTPQTDEAFLDIYYLNDLHGSLLDDGNQMGVSYIANLINTKRTENEETVLFLAGGDMLQGSALSNYYNGESTINLLNLAHLDAFTIGNHEFDWGLDSILEYRDENIENGETNFPFLGANIFYKGTTDMPDGVDPYTIIEKGGHKIGIIGTIGFGLEGSIAESKIAAYDFASPLPIIKEYTTYLRNTEGCDLIIVMSHDSGSYIGNEISNLTGDYKVDIFFNAHSHQSYVDGTSTYVQIQSGSNGRFVGHVHVDFDNGISMTASNLDASDETLLTSKDASVSNKLEEYILETNHLFNEEILVSGDYLSQSYLSEWISQVMLQATNSDIAFQNYGGTRSTINENDSITYATLYQIFPFDNIIKTSELTGRQIKSLMKASWLAHYTTITNFDDNTLYTVVTNDYVYDKPENPFMHGENKVNTGLLMRDLALQEMKLQATIYNEFLPNHTTLINPTRITEDTETTSN